MDLAIVFGVASVLCLIICAYYWGKVVGLTEAREMFLKNKVTSRGMMYLVLSSLNGK